MERHVLVVLAHPDDETYGCGGMIALHTRDGVPVTYVCATRGEMGRRMGRPPFATRESLGELREQELRAACAALGVRDLRLLGLWDKTVEFADPAELAGRIAEVVVEVQPSLVITFHPVHGGHPDHCAIGAATVAAAGALPPAQRPRLRCIGATRALQEAGLEVERVDITAVSHVKQAAFQAHRSQSEGLREQIARDPERKEWVRRMFAAEHLANYQW